MDLIDVLQNRYSCRTYLNKDVDDLILYKIINYASLSPSAGNLQPWKIIIVKNKEKRNSLSIAALNQTWMNQAPVHIVVFGNEEYVKRFYKIKGDIYCKQDCAAFIQNILLVAKDLGLDTCWIGAFDNEMVKRELNVPDNLIPYAIITLGYGSDKNFGKIRNDIQSFTYFDSYGNKKEDRSIIPLEKHVKGVRTQGKNFLSKIKEKLIKHPE